MSTDVAEELRGIISSAQTAVSNAKMRSRLRGESVELQIAGERIDEGLALLNSITESDE